MGCQLLSVCPLVFILTLSNLVWQGTPGAIVGTSVSITNGSVTGFTDASVTGLPSGLPANSLSINLGGFWNQGSTARITLTVEHVPEPGTIALFGLGLAGLGFARRKKA